MSTTKKYFWLKLKKDFFKRHDIRIIEAMENGKDYILFYMKLLVESVSHDGELRFSESIPYDEKMLSIITNTNIDIVRSAVKVFSELNMMETLDDGTIFLQEVAKMTGYETSDAIRMRNIRAEQKQEIARSEQCSKTFKKRSPEIEKEIEKELEKESNTPPRIKAFIAEWKKQFPKKKFNEIDFNNRISSHDYLQHFDGLAEVEISQAVINFALCVNSPEHSFIKYKQPHTFLKSMIDYVDDAEPVKSKRDFKKGDNQKTDLSVYED